jgi:hypothetical protein
MLEGAEVVLMAVELMDQELGLAVAHTEEEMLHLKMMLTQPLLLLLEMQV